MTKHTHLLVPLVALTTGACGIDLGLDTADPRAGDRSVLAFRSEGCTSTTVMAVGASDRLRLEALDGGALPDGLTVDSATPTVIDASAAGGSEVLVTAKSEGRTYLSVHQMGMLLDGITLEAVPARSVKARSVDRVLRGGHADVVIDEVMGVCGGQVCELFGSGFLSWRSEPEGALSAANEKGRHAGFTVSASGTLFGREPARGADLVKLPIVAVSPDEITGFAASIVAVTKDGGATATLPLPATALANAYLCVRLDARHPDGDVPLSSHDLTWSFDGAAADPIDGIHEPLCTLVATGAPGPVTLRVSSPLFAEQPSFALTLE
ncbi:MAG: hypothetical protein RIF41_31630 [Polyangiaceae bacterium]